MSGDTSQLCCGTTHFKSLQYKYKSLRIDPSSELNFWHAARLYTTLSKREETYSYIKQAKGSGSNTLAKTWLGYIYGSFGDKENEEIILGELTALQKTENIIRIGTVIEFGYRQLLC